MKAEGSTKKGWSKRRRFIVAPQYQLTLMVVNLFTLSICFIGVFAETKIAFSKMRELGINQHLSLDKPYYRFLNLEERAFLFYLGLVFVGVTLISLFFTLLYSHRTAGPLVRLHEYFKEIHRRGALPDEQLRFRKTDVLYDLSHSINAALKVFRKEK